MRTVNAILINSSDNCVTLTDAADAGDAVVYMENDSEIKTAARSHVPKWHKIAVKPVCVGGGIYKYGAIIGEALCDIETGEHIHTHNITSPATSASAYISHSHAPSGPPYTGPCSPGDGGR